MSAGESEGHGCVHVLQTTQGRSLTAGIHGLRRGVGIGRGTPPGALGRLLEDQSLKTLEEAARACPGSLQALGYLGDAYLRRRSYPDALRVFATYLERVPRSPFAAMRRDAVLSRLGRHEDALGNAAALLARHPGSLTVLEALASRQIDARQLEAARTTLARGLVQTPGHPVLLTRQSFVELESDRPDAALLFAEKAVAAIGDGRGELVAGYAHIDLARALAILGRRDEAKVALHQALRLGVGPDDLERIDGDPRLQGFMTYPIELPPAE